ncbi:putative ATP-dependent endonuclease of OLD family [Psychrobacter sp. PL19]|uniref:ATP-dependent nuclease n=1 Tax=Psychrobacter sp. PL19 TaxID=2760711 RepID=UPI001AE7B081
MAILINVVRISGFRGISNLEITLPKVAVLIGQNNAGKTSIIKALQVALGDYGRHLTDEDFYINSNDSVCSEIIVDISIVPVDENSQRTNMFSDEWIEVFGDWVQADIEENDFVAIRTICEKDSIKGGFKVSRYPLSRWPRFENWTDESAKINNKISKLIDAIPFVAIDAQRDICQDLREKNSYMGKVLSDISFESDDKEALEDLIAELNERAVEKSTVLSELRKHLDLLNQSFEGQGQTDITPFPKKIRDLSKQFSIHFGEDEANSFSMEYHGMGTRSWASMLTVKAFIDILEKKHVEEEECFFPIIAAEEPEAHLHPNAQRTLYKQLTDIKGQTIISSHSPYLAALANQQDLRVIAKSNGQGIRVFSLNEALQPEELRKIHREVIHSKGELLFSTAIVLSEGETEAQALPLLFERYFSKAPFNLGINFIGVGGSGSKYKPYLTFARDFNIPVFIFSDGEEKPIKDLQKVFDSLFGGIDITTATNVTILEDTDFEGYLLNSGFQGEIETAIKAHDGDDRITKYISNKQGNQTKAVISDKPRCETCNQPIYECGIYDYSDDDGYKKAILEILDSDKTKYAKVVADHLSALEPEALPPKIIALFEQIKAGAEL